MLATGGLWFSRQEKRYEHQIAENRSQDEALQAYLDKMRLLLKEDLRTPINSGEVRSVARARTPTVLRRLDKQRRIGEVRSVARARTLTVLRRLDKQRRIAVLQFLINAFIEADKPIISFAGGELNHYDLSGANLEGANLNLANLSRANLNLANLEGANLSRANLTACQPRRGQPRPGRPQRGQPQSGLL